MHHLFSRPRPLEYLLVRPVCPGMRGGSSRCWLCGVLCTPPSQLAQADPAAAATNSVGATTLLTIVVYDCRTDYKTVVAAPTVVVLLPIANIALILRVTITRGS
jgi:hypothetical protein